jgi:hypothetical protein
MTMLFMTSSVGCICLHPHDKYNTILLFSFHCVKMIAKIIFLLLVWKEVILLIIRSLSKTFKSYKLDNSCIYIAHNNKYSREITNSQSHLSNVVWNECYTYSWVIKHLMESLCQYSSCRTSIIHNPLFVLFTNINSQCVFTKLLMATSLPFSSWTKKMPSRYITPCQP